MNNKLKNMKKLTLVSAIALVGLFLSLAYVSPIQNASVRATFEYADGYDPHGGYLDKVTFVVYPPEDEQLGLQALQANIIYAWDERVPAANIAELEATAGVEVTTEPGDMYRMFCLNGNRFPTNHTGYRRAISFAMDKAAVVQASTGGLAFLQDCAIPIALGNWTYEGELTDTYYAQDIVSANASLEAALFRDLDGDGWRDFDADDSGTLTAGDIDSALFEVDLYHTAGHAPSGNAVELAQDGLELCGIRAVVDPMDFYAMLDAIEVGDYWLSCFTFTNMVSADLLYDLFHSSTGNNQWYFGGWTNATYDLAAENLMNSSTLEEANDWAWECQKILWYEQIMIVCYNDVYTHAYRTDIWEGYVNMQGRNRIGNGYSLVQLQLTDAAGGPYGCYPTEYIMSLNEGLDTTNWLMSNSGYTTTVMQLIYEGLTALSPFGWLYERSLAYDWTTTPTVAGGDIQDGEMYEFSLYENVTWHDGEVFDSEDVVFTLEVLMPQDPYNAEAYENVYKVEAPDAHTVEIYTNATGYFEWTRATGFTVFPEHIWSVPTNVTTFVPTVAEVVGTGPYWFSAHVPGQYVVLERHADWHFGIEHPERPACGPGPINPLLLIGIGVVVVVIIIIAGVYFFRIRK
jgi:ABC-type transport system substrate-binding protein